QDDKLLRLDDSVGDLLGLPNPNSLTVRHLLTMNTGHSAEQIEGLEFDTRALLTIAPEFAPGRYFAYNSDATYALSRIVSALTGETLTGYLRPRLLDPLGIGQRWMSPLFGIEQGFSGFHLTAGDIARLAMVLADGGRYDGVQVIPADYVRDLATPWSDTREHPDAVSAAGAPDNDWTLGYGFQVWRSRHGFRIDGAYGQFGLVIPEKGLAIGYQGASRDTQATLNAMWDFVESIEDGVATPDATASGVLSARAALADAWAGRGMLSADAASHLDTAGWSLVEIDSGWTLRIPGDGVLPALDVAVGADRWAQTVGMRSDAAPLAERPTEYSEVVEGTHLALAARAERTRSGGVLLHVVNTTSPHRLIVEVGGGGEINAGWHTVPLRAPTFSSLLTAPYVLDSAQ
ncbi:MAG: beta-lactamase family protein, partial [Actinobacteria bacterium]|nr:beta-lactamase family protein [Actinomycetota bacterium]